MDKENKNHIQIYTIVLFTKLNKDTAPLHKYSTLYE